MSHPTRVRGLKLKEEALLKGWRKVAPHEGAWIEIICSMRTAQSKEVAPHEGAWIEIQKIESFSDWAAVAPHEGAWIEICSPRS